MHHHAEPMNLATTCVRTPPQKKMLNIIPYDSYKGNIGIALKTNIWGVLKQIAACWTRAAPASAPASFSESHGKRKPSIAQLLHAARCLSYYLHKDPPQKKKNQHILPCKGNVGIIVFYFLGGFLSI